MHKTAGEIRFERARRVMGSDEAAPFVPWHRVDVAVMSVTG
jgi:hypothetical protein